MINVLFFKNASYVYQNSLSISQIDLLFNFDGKAKDFWTFNVESHFSLFEEIIF